MTTVEGASTSQPPSQETVFDKAAAKVSSWFQAKMEPIKTSVDKIFDKTAAKIAERTGGRVDKEKVKKALVGFATLIGKLLLAALVITVAVKFLPVITALSAVSSAFVALYALYHAIKGGKAAYDAGEASLKTIVNASVAAGFDKGVGPQYSSTVKAAKDFALGTIEDINQTKKFFKIIGNVLAESFKKDELETLEF
jgi:hypothetical protein